VIDPTAGTNLIKASAETDVDGNTVDAMSINGDTDDASRKFINTVGVLNGALRTDILTRTVRTLGIGVQAGDVFTIGARVIVQDNFAVILAKWATSPI
jgi:hypothetical protein